jgi:hypothetical protein
MEFMDISLLGPTYRYVVKLEHKFKQKKQEFGDANSSQKKQGKGSPNPQKKGQTKDGPPQDNQSKPQTKKGNEKINKYTGKWCEFHKIPWYKTIECRSKKLLVVELKASESEEGSDSNSDPERGNWIIDVEPNTIVATTKVQPSEPEESDEGERLLHSHMWVKGAPLHFIVNSGSQNNLISTKVIQQLNLSMTLHPHPYTIRWLHQGRDLCIN